MTDEARAAEKRNIELALVRRLQQISPPMLGGYQVDLQRIEEELLGAYESHGGRSDLEPAAPPQLPHDERVMAEVDAAIEREFGDSPTPEAVSQETITEARLCFEQAVEEHARCCDTRYSSEATRRGLYELREDAWRRLLGAVRGCPSQTNERRESSPPTPERSAEDIRNELHESVKRISARIQRSGMNS